MKPVFPRINKAIHFTLEYYEPSQVIEYVTAYTAQTMGISGTSYKVDNWEEFLFNLHDEMEAEILQTIYTSNQNTQVIMFEELREWVDVDWRLGEKPNFNFFWKTIDEYNEKVNSEYEAKLEIEVAKFRNTEEFKTIGENVEFEKEVFTSSSNSGNLFGFLMPTILKQVTETRINRKYYCNNLSANFLDYYQIKTYYDFVLKIVSNFRSKIEKHLRLFDAGKYVTLQDIAIQKENLRLNPPSQKLIDSPTVPHRKLMMDLSVPQLACLFMLLRSLKIINEPLNTELARYVSTNFTTKGSADISEKTLGNQFSSLDTKAIDYWLDLLKQMRIELANLKG